MTSERRSEIVKCLRSQAESCLRDGNAGLWSNFDAAADEIEGGGGDNEPMTEHRARDRVAMAITRLVENATREGLRAGLRAAQLAVQRASDEA